MVISNEKLDFINELSSSVLKSIMGFSDLQRCILNNGKKSLVNPMDMKVFYLFENKNNQIQEMKTDNLN